MEKQVSTTKARTELAKTVNAFSKIAEASESIAERAVHVGRYNTKGAVIIPEADFAEALRREQELEDLAVVLLLRERFASGGLAEGKTVEEFAKELGFDDLT